jgi:cyclopropane-fatty-acyl-phospholipid synthase
MPSLDVNSRIDEWLLRKIHASVGKPQIGLRLRNSNAVSSGTAASSDNGGSLANIIIEDRETLLHLILDPEIGFGDGYRSGRIAVEGDLVTALETAMRSMSEVRPRTWYGKLVSSFMRYAQRNSVRGSRSNIHRHYDLGADFYRLWLDRELVYTCAYFPAPNMTLEEAQIAKMDYVCRKLQLRAGERVVEAGCGWGALALYMAKNYGVTVRAFNISHEQVLWARERAKELGLTPWVEFIEDDYRNIAGECDGFVSVGMLEHVGAENYKELGRVIHRSLSKTGRGLLHFIGRNKAAPFSPWTRKRIFPGAHVPSLRQVTRIFEPWNFSVLDVENLRLHYAKTLEHWLERFEASAKQVLEMFGPEFVRAWRLHLAGSTVGFRAGTLQLFQIVFARSASQQIPWTRTHLYQQEKQESQEAKWMHATS